MIAKEPLYSLNSFIYQQVWIKKAFKEINLPLIIRVSSNELFSSALTTFRGYCPLLFLTFWTAEILLRNRERIPESEIQLKHNVDNLNAE